MDYGVYRYDEPYGYNQPRRRINYFAWTIAILLLTGFAFAAWIASFYIFGQPERPESYRVLQKLHKIDPPKRFELTAAPKGEFLDAKQLFDRYAPMGTAELARANAELVRNYIRNFQQVRGLVPYITGRFVIMDARELGPNDVFTSGMVALTGSIEHGEILLEHVYPADPQALNLMQKTLNIGLQIKLERTHDLSAVVHVERVRDGRLLFTAVPLLYGTYTVTRGTGTFTLEPPLDLHLEGGWPFYKEQSRLKAELRFAEHRKETEVSGSAQPIPGMSQAPLSASANALVRVEKANPVEVAQATPAGKAGAKPTPEAKKGKLAKGQKPTPAPSVAPSAAPAIAQQTPAITAASPAASAKPAQSAAPTPAMAVAVATASPPPAASPADTSGALASTAGGGTWKTFPAGKMPLGRLIAASDLKDLADRGMGGERVYLKGQFVVNASDANRAVLRPRTRLASAMLHLGGPNTRIIVEFPAGYAPPAQGSVVSREDNRPLEITEVRKQEDGQLNVFAREIMQ